MRMIAILLVLAAILGRQPLPTKPPTSHLEAEEIWKLTLPEVIRVQLEKPTVTVNGTDEFGNYFWMGSMKIYTSASSRSPGEGSAVGPAGGDSKGY